MAYKVVVTADAVDDIERFIRYLIVEKKSPQSASAVLNDFEESIKTLAIAAESFKLCDNPKLREHGYRRKNFKRHRYFLMYRVVENTVYVDSVFHELQDYENIMG